MASGKHTTLGQMETFARMQDERDDAQEDRLQQLEAAETNKRFKYALIGNPGIYDADLLDTVPNSDTAPSEIYAFYDAIMASNPDIVSKEILGYDGYQNPIYCYTFDTPKTVYQIWDNGASAVSEWDDTIYKPVVILVGGTHGNEKGSAWGLAQYLTQMYGNNANAETDFVRDNAILKVVPILNVSGFADNTRHNRAGVDLNRDFEAFSQPESNLMVALYEQYKDDAVILLDCHNTIQRGGFWNPADDFYSRNLLLSLYRQLSKRLIVLDSSLAEYEPIMSFLSFTAVGVQANYFYEKGLFTATVESSRSVENMKGDRTSLHFDALGVKAGMDLLGNTLIQFLRAVEISDKNYMNTGSSEVSSLYVASQPENTAAFLGDMVSFGCGSSVSDCTYQWQWWKAAINDWSDTTVSGNTSTHIVMEATEARNGNQYRCVITDTEGNQVVTNPVTLTIIGENSEAITIGEHPVNVDAAYGDTVEFAVAASGANLVYRWQFYDPNNSELSGWRVVKSGSGFRSPKLTTTAVDFRDGYQYRCVITDEDGNTAISDAAVLSITSDQSNVVITSQPESVTATLGETVSFTVEAEGDGLTYQWQWWRAEDSQWVATSVSGNTTDTITVEAADFRNGYQYRCVITDANGNQVISDVVTLTVVSA